MSVVHAASITLDDERTVISVGDDPDPSTFILPCGVRSLGLRHIHSDPPLPEELTNAIGEMMDHVEDAKRELPQLLEATSILVSGPVPRAVAAVEVGGSVASSRFVLTRDAAEDVFRTLATENHADRRHNPGLPVELVPAIVGGCCALVGLIRGLQLASVTVQIDPTTNGTA